MRVEGEGAEMVDRKQVNVDKLSPRILSQDFSHLFCAEPGRTSKNGTEVRLKVKMWHFLRITNFSPFTSLWFKRCVYPKCTEWKQNRPEEKKKAISCWDGDTSDSGNTSALCTSASTSVCLMFPFYWSFKYGLNLAQVGAGIIKKYRWEWQMVHSSRSAAAN